LIDLASTRFIAVDTETTGLEPRKGARLTEIAAVTVLSGKILETEIFQELIDPGCAIPKAISKMTGITDAMVKDKPKVKEVLERFIGWVHPEAILVFQNASFDLCFLDFFSDKNQLTTLSNLYCDTMELYRSLYEGKSGLDTILSRLEIVLPYEMRHRALGDALGTALVFSRLADEIGSERLESYLHRRSGWKSQPWVW
jgi:DNA polymerase-3 subunit epsilon